MTREELEWSMSTAVSRLKGLAGCCPYCGNRQDLGHDPECGFMTGMPTEQIIKEIQEAKEAADRCQEHFFDFEARAGGE